MTWLTWLLHDQYTALLRTILCRVICTFLHAKYWIAVIYLTAVAISLGIEPSPSFLFRSMMPTSANSVCHSRSNHSLLPKQPEQQRIWWISKRWKKKLLNSQGATPTFWSKWAQWTVEEWLIGDGLFWVFNDPYKANWYNRQNFYIVAVYLLSPICLVIHWSEGTRLHFEDYLGTLRQHCWDWSHLHKNELCCFLC